MRHESSTVVALVGPMPAGLLAALAESANISVVRAAGSEATDARGLTEARRQGRPAGPDLTTRPAGPDLTTRSAGEDRSHAAGPAELAAWEPGARALREAARRRATYVVVADDPLAGVASAWRAMWETASGPGSAASFEEQAVDALAAWRAEQFELPDYYLVAAPVGSAETRPDLYLGPLRAARPRRVAVTGILDRAVDPAAAPAMRASLLGTLRSLQHGPWWPPLGQLLDAARGFYAGGLTEIQRAR